MCVAISTRPAAYLVVLHPKGALPDEQLLSAGLPQALLPELLELRIRERPAIYVMATGADVRGAGANR
jgi:hypothetical protein